MAFAQLNQRRCVGAAQTRCLAICSVSLSAANGALSSRAFRNPGLSRISTSGEIGERFPLSISLTNCCTKQNHQAKRQARPLSHRLLRNWQTRKQGARRANMLASSPTEVFKILPRKRNALTAATFPGAPSRRSLDCRVVSSSVATAAALQQRFTQPECQVLKRRV
jgi:hypothetical protein